MDIPQNIIAASALANPTIMTEETPPLTDAFPIDPVPHHDLIEKKRKGKYLHHIRKALRLRENGRNEKADRALQKALDALESLRAWYQMPFVRRDRIYRDRVHALYWRVREERGVICGTNSRRGLPLRSYEYIPKDAEKAQQIARLSGVLALSDVRPAGGRSAAAVVRDRKAASFGLICEKIFVTYHIKYLVYKKYYILYTKIVVIILI